jgi:hypothetical protein
MVFDLEYNQRWTHDLGDAQCHHGHAHLLALGKGDLTKDQRRSVTAIEKQVQRLEQLLGDLETTDGADEPGTPLLSGVFQSDMLSLPRVLIADDDQEMVALLSELLAGRYELSFAKDGREALASLGSGAFHLAIIDLHHRCSMVSSSYGRCAQRLAWTPA